MRFLVFVFLLISLKTFAQKDSLQSTIPVFYKSDPRIYNKGKMEIPVSLLGSSVYYGDLTPVKITDTSEGYIPKIGLVNNKGKFVVPAELDGLGSTLGKNIVIYKNGKAGLIDDQGNTIVDTKYKSIEFVNKDTVRAINFSTLHVRYDAVSIFKEYAADSIRPDGNTYHLYMNGQKKEIFHPEWPRGRIPRAEEGNPPEHLHDGSGLFQLIKYKEKVGIENLECNTIIAPVYDSIQYIASDSIYIVYWKKKMGIMDRDGSELLPLSDKFQKIFSFNNGRAKILKNGRYGFIDRIGNVHISPQYPGAHDFSEGYAGVIINGKWGFLDKEEQIAVQPFYQEVRDFQNGTARVKEKNKWYFINKEGKKITTTPYDDILFRENKRWLLVIKNKYGLADSLGKELLAPKYDQIEDLNNGYVIVKKFNKWGVLDYQQNFYIPIDFDGIVYDEDNRHFITAIQGKEELIPLSQDKKRRKGK
jgi:hypothetical protein